MTLPYYSMFDNLGFRIDGPKVTLSGELWWPNLKNTAERLVANLEGITSVENQIEVLPTSSYDDRLRLATARVLFSHPVLRKCVRPGGFFRPTPSPIRYPHHREERRCDPRGHCSLEDR